MVQEKKEAFSHLVEEIDITLPFWRYFEIFRKKPCAYFLDSSLADEALGNYSLMGSDPFLIYRAYIDETGVTTRPAVRVTLSRPANEEEFIEEVTYYTDDLFSDLRRVFNQYAGPAPDPGPAIPFHAGCVGFLAYEAGALIEQVPIAPEDDLRLPVACFLFVDYTLAHCHRTGKTFLSVAAPARQKADLETHLAAKRAWLRAELERVERNDFGNLQNGLPDPGADNIEFESQHDRDSYRRDVEKIQAYIREGAAYEVCLTHRYACPQIKDPWALYGTLRSINPAPFAGYFQVPEVQVICSSPERFLRLDQNRRIESRPIKGTRPRGETPLTDLALEDDLRSSPKDRAENLMIVDLVRNDLSRVAEVGSVHVPEFFKVERYATVMQLVSAIHGVLKAEYDVFDLIRACFPGGSMTGAPKIEAMKIISSLEKTRRGIYSGAIGYIDFSGAADLNIVIRSIVVHDGRCYFSVGGAIVSDSDPDGEYQETLDKANALVAALRA